MQAAEFTTGNNLVPVTLPLIEKRQRFYWLDVAKSVGIFCIVLGHFRISTFAYKFLWTFHVPLFFFISGWLFKVSSTPVFLKKLSFRLILPYVYIYLLTVVITIFQKSDFNGQHIIRMVLGMFWGTHSYRGFINSALWFLPGLITVQVLYFFGVRKSKLVYGILLGISIYFYQKGYLNLFFSFDLSLLGLNYFVIGVLVKKHKCIEFALSRPFMAAAFFLCCLAGTVAFAQHGNVWYGGRLYLISLLGGMTGITMILMFSLLVERVSKPTAFVQYVSGSTLTIFCFHGFSNRFAKAIVDIFALQSAMVNVLLATAVSIFLLLPIHWLIVRFVPELVGVKRTRHPEVAIGA